MDLRDVSDRADIADLIARHTRALDTRRFDDLDELFTADAHVDYSAFGGAAGLATTKGFLADSMALFEVTQHMLGLPAITLEGDRAAAVTPCHNPMALGAGLSAQVMVGALWYHHELVRTAEGWRIRRCGRRRSTCPRSRRGAEGPPRRCDVAPTTTTTQGAA